MSLKKKDPTAPGGLRVAANDPHLVSLGGGRLSTAVTIHYLPVGNMTIGSSPTCSVSLNGSSVRPLHCTVYRNGQDEVTIVPENDARVLIDGNKITSETKLTQGAMLTIGNSNYLRFNNPAEAQLIKSVMGSNERISMPQIDFTQDSNGGTPEDVLKNFTDILESQSYQKPNNDKTVLDKITNVEYININNFHSPKVFTADSVTVNTPAKDVLGPKYANFAKNLAENHKNDKKFCTKNNEMNLKTNNYVNIPTSFIQNSPNLTNCNNEVLTKVNNNNVGVRNQQQIAISSAYDRYPKPGSYGGLQLFPMNGVNSEINTTIRTDNDYQSDTISPLEKKRQQAQEERLNEQKISAQEQERLEEILKICAEYERQNQSIQSSPIVQNRIKTNGSLPREKKSPFYDCNSQSPAGNMNNTSHGSNNSGGMHHAKTFFPDKPTKVNSGYENVKILGDRRIEICPSSSPKNSSGYENVSIIGNKYVPQSPRTKIRTTCASPKKEHLVLQQQQQQQQQSHYLGVPQTMHPSITPQASVSIPSNQSNTIAQANEYAHLIHTFEEKLRLEMQSIKDTGKPRDTSTPETTPISTQKRRQNRNINNLTLNLNNSTENTDKNRLQNLKKDREDVLSKIRKLKTQIADLQRQEDEVLRELDMEKALVTAELSSVSDTLIEMERNFGALQAKIHRLEAQRNANRVMQETQQAKLKQSIEIKQEQVSGLEKMLQENKSDESLKEELNKVIESLENDRKTFEDLEFQYLEEETDWLAYREELHTDLKLLTKHIEGKRLQVIHLENQGIDNQNTACSDTKTLESSLLSLLTTLEKSREELQAIDQSIFEISGQQEQILSDSEEEDSILDCGKDNRDHISNLMSQSLFGSAELISSANKVNDVDIMSRSVNENMLFHTIEFPSKDANKTNHLKLSISQENYNDTTNLNGRKFISNGNIIKKIDDVEKKIEITPEVVLREKNIEKDPLLKLKYNVESNSDTGQDQDNKMNLNLSLGNDDFEVNPLEKRVPSQDDIDRISKITLDAPISTKGAASSKIIESIKEIERNRQLLLAQQGSHVIEHARQKMVELKKKSHDEARAQYLSLQNEQHNFASSGSSSNSSGGNATTTTPTSYEKSEENKYLNGENTSNIQDHHSIHLAEKELLASEGNHRSQSQLKSQSELRQSQSQQINQNQHTEHQLQHHYHQQQQQQNGDDHESSQQRHSHPEAAESQRERPLSEANSELSYDNLSDSIFKCNKTNLSSSTNRLSENSEDARRSSLVSNDTMDGGDRLVSGNKRCLPKHQRPLTRYLPIMSPDLDLRQHIETAGHQITLCPHVFVDSYSCRGYLHKLGATFHGWSRRWFVLDRQKSALIYYSDKSEKKPRGGAYFSTIDEVYLDHLNTSKSGRPHCTFIVKTKKRSYHLQAASDAAARIWIDAIITGAQGNLDY